MGNVGRSYLKDRLLIFFGILLGISYCFAQEQDHIVLDTSSFWRVYYSMTVPTVIRDGKLKKMKTEWNVCGPHRARWIEPDMPLPPDNWMDTGFDDSSWTRVPGILVWGGKRYEQKDKKRADNRSLFVAPIFKRGKFEIKDPSLVKDLKLTIEYRGGVIIYMNGKEVTRGHIPEQDQKHIRFLAESTQPGESGNRKIENIVIPKNYLQKGGNVLAVALYSSAYNEQELIWKLKRWPQGAEIPKTLCGLDSIRLTVSDAAKNAIVPNVSRPKGFQAWNASVLSPDFDLDFGDPHDALKPIRIVGTRNGTFSGKVVVGSDQPIKGFKTKVTDLINSKGAISSSSVRVRYAKPFGKECFADYRYLASVSRLDALDEVVPDTIPVREKKPVSWRPGKKISLESPGIVPVPGAVVPIWITIHAPSDAPAGDYRGKLIITSKDGKDVEVPIELVVHAWKLPDPQDYCTWVDIIQSPETLALGYNIPLWSKAHFNLIEKSLKIIAEAGNKVVFIHLMCETNQGNEQTMIRWIKQVDGTYKYDFTAFDTYMDLVQKYMGDPPVVCLYLWDRFVGNRKCQSGGYGVGKLNQDMGPEVTVLDPETGEVSKLQLPGYTDPKGKALWKPLAEEIIQRMKNRGLYDFMMLGLMNDFIPTMDIMEAVDEIFPGVKWACYAHVWPSGEWAPYVAYKGNVFSQKSELYVDPSVRRIYGWKEKEPRVYIFRMMRENWPLTSFRLLPEMCIIRKYRGFGRMGGDFLPVLKARRGHMKRIDNRFPKSFWNNMYITALLAKGEKGPIATARFEMLREGIQECEARIFIEKALTDETLRQKLGDKLVARCQEQLDHRTRMIRRGIAPCHRGSYGRFQPVDKWVKAAGLFGGYWFLGSGWQKRSDDLYRIAADVAKALGGLVVRETSQRK